MSKKITYEDKIAIYNDPEVPEESKVTDENMNNIKEVVNNNADELDEAKKTAEQAKETAEGIKPYDDTDIKQQISDIEQTIPKNTSDLNNDSKFQTEEEVQESIGQAKEELQGKIDKCVKTTEFQESQETQDTNITKLQEEIKRLKEIAGHIYTAVFDTETNTSTLEREDNATRLIANATKNGQAVQNDFDNCYPWRDIKSCNIDTQTGEVKAWIGDSNFSFDGTNGDVFTYIPRFWFKIWKDGSKMYFSIADYDKEGYTEIKEFYVARYKTSLVDGVPHSYSGLIPGGSLLIGQHRDNIKNNLSEDFCLLDWRFFAIRLLYIVEYADFNSQNVLGRGRSFMHFGSNNKTLITEENTNRVIVDSRAVTASNGLFVGQNISIGSYEGAYNVARDRTITEINDYTEGEVVGKEILFDGEPVNITTTRSVWSSAQKSGECDSLKMKSGCLTDDQKHAVIYRGIEDIYGNIVELLDGINVRDHQTHVCYNPEQYENDKFEEPYKPIGYKNSDVTGYIKEIGFDENNPLIQIPIKVEEGANDSHYYCDRYAQTTGDVVPSICGSLQNGDGNGIMKISITYKTTTGATWDHGSRIIKYK